MRKGNFQSATMNLFGWTVVCLTLLTSCGCHRGPKCYPISGKVTWKGNAVPMGTITFVPESGGRPASGKIAEDGSYELSSFENGDGAQAGEYVVLLECVKYPESTEAAPKTFAEELAQQEFPKAAKRVKPPTWYVPEEYASPDTSPLKQEVTERATIDFVLPGDQ